MLGGLILGGNAFYAVFVGTANGMHQFHKQAGLDITFATLRAVGLIGMAMLGLGVVGVDRRLGRRGRPHPRDLRDRGSACRGKTRKRIGCRSSRCSTFFLHIAVYLALFNG